MYPRGNSYCLGESKNVERSRHVPGTPWNVLESFGILWSSAKFVPRIFVYKPKENCSIGS